MIELKYLEINSPAVDQVFFKIKKMPMSGKIAYDLSKILSKWKDARVEVSKKYKELVLDVYAELDEKGNVIPDPKDPTNFHMKEGKTLEELAETHKEFSTTIYKLECTKLPMKDLLELKLTPEDFEVLALIAE